jgi:hypothetical protein
MPWSLTRETTPFWRQSPDSGMPAVLAHTPDRSALSIAFGALKTCNPLYNLQCDRTTHNHSSDHCLRSSWVA